MSERKPTLWLLISSVGVAALQPEERVNGRVEASAVIIVLRNAPLLCVKKDRCMRRSRTASFSLVPRRSLLVAIALVALLYTPPTKLRADETPGDTKSANKPVDFAHDIAPILQKRCAKCHTGTQRKGGLSLNTRQTLLSGGDGGPVVVPRKSAESTLVGRVTSDDPNERMPPEGERLTPAQIELFRRWIDLDLSWEDGFAFGKMTRQAPLAPRRPAVPSGPAVAKYANPVDRFLHVYFDERKLPARESVSDRIFARRVSYDLVGLPPSPTDLAALEADSSPDKRERYVDRLLADRPAYAAHWLTFWNDLLRNAYHGTGFIDGGRKQITSWLYAAIYDNQPYNRFVHDLVSPPAGSGSEGFSYGIKWRGTVNESQRREIQAAQSVAQVFLGTNLKCASCHDSFVNHWKLTDAYALASVFADGPLELHRCDQPTGVASTIGFLYPQLGTIDAKGSRAERAQQLADLLTNSENGRLGRTIVNRLWAKLFGHGLVEPLDNMDAEPWHQDLLDFLAADLADHGYDLKRTLRLLATSRAYQLPGVGHDRGPASDEAFVFRGPIVKRLSAEQFVDAVFGLTSSWPSADAGAMQLDGRGQGGQLGAIAAALGAGSSSKPAVAGPPLKTAKWVWSSDKAREGVPPQTIYLRREWTIKEQPVHAVATFTADNSFELWINGKSVGKSDNWSTPAQIDVTEAVVPGKNVVALKAVNGGSGPNPAGAIGEIVTLSAEGKPISTLTTDDKWRVSEVEAAAWLKADFDASAWKAAVVLGDAGIGPWNVAAIVQQGVAAASVKAQLPADFRVRSALLPLDPLQAALGRPNREQVVSSRDTAPTMLQALELTNGVLLGRYLKQGAANWHKQSANDPQQLIDQIYQTALSRSPTESERKLAVEIAGTPVTLEGLEDLLWSLCMLPEFQLVP